MKKDHEMKLTKTTCEHDIRVRGEEKVCATCNTVVGPAYTLDRLNDDIRFLLGRVTQEYQILKAKFLTEAAKDPSDAITWHAYDLLVAQHRAEYVDGLRTALADAKTSTGQRDLIKDEQARLTRHLTRASAAEWDSSASPFSNQNMKARTVADARSLRILRDVYERFEHLDADLALPRVAQS